MFEQIIEAIRGWLTREGLTAEEAVRKIAEGLTGEQVATLTRAPAGFRLLRFTARSGTGPAGAGASLTDAERDLVLRCRMDPAKVAEGMAQEAEERAARKRREAAPLVLSDAERIELRRRGHNVELLERMGEVHSLDDFRRVRREVGADGPGRAA